MDSQIQDLLSKRTEFLSLLDEDIDKNQFLCSELETKVKSLEQLRQNIDDLSQQPEHTALIPLCKRLYMPGTIVHTGEYLVTKKAQPESYSALKTARQTVQGVEAQIKEQEGLLEEARSVVSQLSNRKKLLLGEEIEEFVANRHLDEFYPLSEEMASMPQEIKSDKGVAVKVGDFFDILEYEEVG